MSDNPSIDNVPLSPKGKLVSGIVTVDYFDDVADGDLDLTLNAYAAVTILDNSTLVHSKTYSSPAVSGHSLPFNFNIVTAPTGGIAILQAIANIGGTAESSPIQYFTVA